MPSSSPTPLSRLERDVVDAIDLNRLVADVRALVGIPSWGGEEEAAQRWMAERSSEVGLEVDAWPVDLPALTNDPHYSAEISRSAATGVVGTLRGSESSSPGPSLLINGHVDVVPPGDLEHWSRPPFEGAIDDGRLIGRGALDLKGPLLAGLHALDAIRRTGVRLRGDVHLMSVFGEEDGGSGTLAALRRGWSADAAIVVEPTGFSIGVAQAGCLNFRIRVTGRAAHAAVRTEGVSVLDLWPSVREALRRLEARRHDRWGGDPLFADTPLPFAVSVGTVRAGSWPSTVPEALVAEGRIGVAPGESFEAVRREFEDAVATAGAGHAWMERHPPTVEWWGGRFLPTRTAVDHPLVTAVRSAGDAVLGSTVPLCGVPYGSDMGLLGAVGRIPTVLFGCGDIRRAHGPDEWVGIDELRDLAAALAVSAMRYCGVAEAGEIRRSAEARPPAPG